MCLTHSGTRRGGGRPFRDGEHPRSLAALLPHSYFHYSLWWPCSMTILTHAAPGQRRSPSTPVQVQVQVLTGNNTICVLTRHGPCHSWQRTIARQVRSIKHEMSPPALRGSLIGVAQQVHLCHCSSIPGPSPWRRRRTHAALTQRLSRIADYRTLQVLACMEEYTSNGRPAGFLLPGHH